MYIVIVIVIVKFHPNPLWKTVPPNKKKKKNDKMSSSDMDYGSVPDLKFP